MHRDRPHPHNNHRYRAWSQILIKPPQRLVFPNRQAEEGYVGKKHFRNNNSDNIVLQSPDPHKYVRKDKLDIGDIQGAKPRLIQPLENVRNHHKRDSASLDPHSEIRRTKTEVNTQGQDSLDVLVKYSDNNNHKSKKSNFEDQISSYLWKRNIELTKQNILGIYNPGSSPDSSGKNSMARVSMRNPTYLSHLNGPLLG